MKVNGKHYRTIFVKKGDNSVIQVIDQRREYLPHEFVIRDLKSVEGVYTAIKDMWVRGAGLIGVTAAYGMYLAALEAREKCSIPANQEEYIHNSAQRLISTRPTAVNLAWAVKRQLREIKKGRTIEDKVRISFDTAGIIADEDSAMCRSIGENGARLIKDIYKRNGQIVRVMTHCNAGWLTFADWGSALSPVYVANEEGIPVHVWVSETRPWNQGSRLTAWELDNENISHKIISDNEAGYLMRQGLVDMCIVGADRVARNGDVANKIGTYLKALAAADNKIPFYVAFPSSTFDKTTVSGEHIPIERRDPEEVKYAYGLDEKTGKMGRVLTANKESPAENHSFDITHASLITRWITEYGVHTIAECRKCLL